MLNINIVYALTSADSLPNNWQGEKGFINPETIKKYAPDFKERTFYISGPRSMIVSFDDAFKKMGVHKTRIKTDFFPGFA